MEDARGQGGGEAHSEDSAEVVYPKRSEAIGRLVLLGLFIGIVGVVVVVLSPFRETSAPRVGATLAFFAAVAVLVALVVWAARVVRDLVRQARAPLPILRLDQDGLECALGQLLWPEVERIRVDRHSGDHGDTYTLVFVAHAGSGPSPPLRRYYRGPAFRGPKRAATGIETSLWSTRPEVLTQVRRFYRGPVSDEHPTPLRSLPLESRRRTCPACGYATERDKRRCRQCGSESEPWTFRDGLWSYTSANGRLQWLDEGEGVWRWADDGTPSSTPAAPSPSVLDASAHGREEHRGKRGLLGVVVSVASLLWLILACLVCLAAIWPPDAATIWAVPAFGTCLVLLLVAIGRERSGRGRTWQLALLSPLAVFGPFVLALLLLRARIRRNFAGDLRSAVRGTPLTREPATVSG